MPSRGVARITDFGRIPLGLAAGLLALATGCGDTAPPQYPVSNSFLRLIPDQNPIDSGDQSVFVLIEFSQADGGQLADGGAPLASIFLQTTAGTLTALPGPVLCASDAGTGSNAGLVIPNAGLRQDSSRSLQEAGFLFSLPASSAGAIIAATAYAADSALACSPASTALIAEGVLRISRAAADAGTDAGVSDAGAAGSDDAGQVDGGLQDGGTTDAGQ